MWFFKRPELPEDFIAKVRKAFPKEIFPAQARDLERYIRQRKLGNIVRMVHEDLVFAKLDTMPYSEGEPRPYADAVEHGDRLILMQELAQEAYQKWPSL